MTQANDICSALVRDFNRRVQDVTFSKKYQTKMSERSIYLKIDGCMHPLPKIDGCSSARRTHSNQGHDMRVVEINFS